MGWIEGVNDGRWSEKDQLAKAVYAMGMWIPAATVYWTHKMHQTLCLYWAYISQFNSHTKLNEEGAIIISMS